MSPPIAAFDLDLVEDKLSLMPWISEYGMIFKFLGDLRLIPVKLPANDNLFKSNPNGRFAQYAVSLLLLMLRWKLIHRV